MFVKSLVFVLFIAVVAQLSTAEKQYTSILGRAFHTYAEAKRNVAANWDGFGNLLRHDSSGTKTTVIGDRKRHVADFADKLAEAADKFSASAKKTGIEVGINLFTSSQKGSGASATSSKKDTTVSTSPSPGSAANPYFAKPPSKTGQGKPIFSHPSGPSSGTPTNSAPAVPPPQTRSGQLQFWVQYPDGTKQLLDAKDIVRVAGDLQGGKM